MKASVCPSFISVASVHVGITGGSGDAAAGAILEPPTGGGSHGPTPPAGDSDWGAPAGLGAVPARFASGTPLGDDERLTAWVVGATADVFGFAQASRSFGAMMMMMERGSAGFDVVPKRRRGPRLTPSTCSSQSGDVDPSAQPHGEQKTAQRPRDEDHAEFSMQRPCDDLAKTLQYPAEPPAKTLQHPRRRRRPREEEASR